MQKHLPNIFVTGNQIRASTSYLKAWDKNPREITVEEYEQLKNDIKNKQFKPLIIMDDGTVLGGNMRIRAYKETGVTDVWVSVISLKEEGELVKAFVNNEYDQTFQSRHDAMLHYSTRDNQPYGYYVRELTAEEFSNSTLPLDLYKIPAQTLTPLSEIVEEVSPPEELIGEDERGNKFKKVTCPNCSFEFDV